MVAGLLGIVLLLFELVLIARLIVDWVGMLSPVGADDLCWTIAAIGHKLTDIDHPFWPAGRTHSHWA